MRDAVWMERGPAKKNGLIVEEWLTEHRSRLFKKCKELKAAKLIKDVATDNGEIIATLKNCSDDKKIVVVTDSDYESLVKMTRKS